MPKTELVRKPGMMVDFGSLLGAIPFRPKIAPSDFDGVIHLGIKGTDYFFYIETKTSAFAPMSRGQQLLLEAKSRQINTVVFEVIISGKKTSVGGQAFEPVLYRQLGAEDWTKTNIGEFRDLIAAWAENCKKEAA